MLCPNHLAYTREPERNKEGCLLCMADGVIKGRDLELKALDASVASLKERNEHLTKGNLELRDMLKHVEREYEALQAKTRSLVASATNPHQFVPKEELEKETRNVEELREQLEQAREDCDFFRRIVARLVRED